MLQAPTAYKGSRGNRESSVNKVIQDIKEKLEKVGSQVIKDPKVLPENKELLGIKVLQVLKE